MEARVRSFFGERPAGRPKRRDADARGDTLWPSDRISTSKNRLESITISLSTSIRCALHSLLLTMNFTSWKKIVVRGSFQT